MTPDLIYLALIALGLALIAGLLAFASHRRANPKRGPFTRWQDGRRG